MFKVTVAAAKQIMAASEQSGTEGLALRLAARENQDGSFAYNMGFDEVSDEDIRVTSEEVEIIMDPAFEKLLEETTLDFVELEDEEGSQFVFLNPLDPTYVPPKKDKEHN